MSKYGQYCPMARAVEILGDRWTLLIVRDLYTGTHHFNALERGLPGISKALLAERLKRLEKAGVVERREEGIGKKTCYTLTQAGLALRPVIENLTRWGATWAFGEPDPEELNPLLLMWWFRDRVRRDQLPQQRVVIEFDFYESRPHRYWLVAQPDDVSICLNHPGFDIDILVSTPLKILYQVWSGRIPFTRAIDEQQVNLEAPPALIRAFPNWFALSPAAGIVAEVSRQNR